jgi:drug/metabolite transporter (DMT)-like permease
MTESAHLTSGVLAAVLGAAFLHALWNSLVKSADDKFLASALVALWCGAAGLAAGLALPPPSRAAAPFIAVSALVHIVYFLLVGRLYRNADLSVAYPIMRGLAPLIAALIALAALGEALRPLASLGVAVLASGVVLMGLSGLKHGRIDATTLAVALANSPIIAVYSVVDGEGARMSGPGAPFAFAYNGCSPRTIAEHRCKTLINIYKY